MKTFNLELRFPRMTRRILMLCVGGGELTKVLKVPEPLRDKRMAVGRRESLVERPEFTSGLSHLMSSSTSLNHFEMQMILTFEGCLKVKQENV